MATLSVYFIMGLGGPLGGQELKTSRIQGKVLPAVLPVWVHCTKIMVEVSGYGRLNC